MSSPFAAREQTEISPINAPANGYSFRGGFPIMQFEIAASSALLDGKSLRLNGTLRLNTSVSTEATVITPNNKTVVATAGGGVNGGRSTGNFPGGGANTVSQNIALNSRCGVQSCISQITISSQESGQTLEVIRNYGRYIASVAANTHSQDDFDSVEQIQACCASRAANGAQLVNNEVSFSIPLRTGLLQSDQLLPLGANGMRGLIIEVSLASDAQVLGGYTADNVVSVPPAVPTGVDLNDAGVAGGAFYQLRDVTMSYDQMVPETPEVATTGQLVYNSLSSLYSVINTTDSTTTLNLGTARTLSVFHNTIPATDLNTYTKDSFATPRLTNNAGAATSDEMVSFSRGGVLFPLEDRLDVEWTPYPNSSRPLAATSTNYVNAIKSYNRWNHNLMSTETEIVPQVNSAGTGFNTHVDVNGNTVRPNCGADPLPMHGYGVRQDLFKHGVDFSRSNYAVRVQSAGLDAPNALFTYTLAQNTLMYSPQGIRVMS